ncbi:hypothetical protein KX852_28095 [Pseudomonas aeruginosa]|uniref:hypothetical protein n=1 Tax=Pseudomonas aeruginosa TaxID=287 RepID=UPI001C52F825|nr:hypothetical protein [Pseudomonas aeruginosa]MBW0799544.1 hypothetical protein [Pseudomonas aeruginosa]
MALSTHLSNHKLYLLGMLCAILAWGMACIELGANTHLWFSGLSEQGYLQAWSDEMPRLAKGERWSQRNARTLVHIGLLSFLALLLQPFINTLQGLVLSLDLPDGERVLSVSIGLTSEAAYEFLKAIFLCSFGLMMSEARKLDEEVRAFI